jgi:hypothetical protein
MKKLTLFKSFILMVFFGLIIFACSKEEMPNISKETPTFNLEKNGPVIESVTGSGSLVFPNSHRTFSFTAHMYADGTVDGQWQRVNHSSNGQAHSHGIVTCFDIDGNHARLGGFATSGVQSDPPFNGVAWRVEDNGQGNNNPPDRISFQFVGLNEEEFGDVSSYCSGEFGNIPELIEISAGNIKVDGE